jgi:hypothetical protein
MANTTGRKYGGRAKGTPNRNTKNMRVWLSNLLDDNKQQIESDLNDLEPFQRLQMLERLLSYTLPKLSSIEAKVDLNELSEANIDLIINEITKDL